MPASKTAWTTIAWAIVWAAAMIVSAIVLKGHPAKEWVQWSLYIVATVFWMWPLVCASKTRSSCS